MSKFTKGKWTADDMGEYIFAHEFNMMICQMRGWAYLKAQGLSDDEAIDVQKANARLIAAAPDMFELLYEALQELKGYDPIGNGISTIYPDIEELLARIDGDIQEG